MDSRPIRHWFRLGTFDIATLASELGYGQDGSRTTVDAAVYEDYQIFDLVAFQSLARHLEC